MIGSITEARAQLAAIEKGRKARERELAARAETEAAVQDVADADCGKGYAERGAVVGPGDFLEPGQPPDAGTFRRGYLDAGHGAPSPMQDSPNSNPVAGRPQGEPVRITLPGTTVAGRVPATVTSALAMGSPSDR